MAAKPTMILVDGNAVLARLREEWLAPLPDWWRDE